MRAKRTLIETEPGQFVSITKARRSDIRSWADRGVTERREQVAAAERVMPSEAERRLLTSLETGKE